MPVVFNVAPPFRRGPIGACVESYEVQASYTSILGNVYATVGKRAEAIDKIKELEEKYTRKESDRTIYSCGICRAGRQGQSV